MTSMSQKLIPAVTRRTLLKASVAAGLSAAGLALSGGIARAQFSAFPFSLGVASGEPAADGFVIWTRLAPDPLTPRGGMTPAPVEVAFEIADDPAMKRVIRSGTTIARVELAHSVHVDIEGLEPARDYFYRFRVGGVESAVGRARTLPLAGAQVRELKFAAAGCQAWDAGYYTAWRRIAEENFDFVFHYGDYIYEHRTITVDRDNRPLPRVMPANFSVCYTLTDYRCRYALYKSDPDLQAAHASCPFLPSFDDHDVAGNWAAETDPRSTPAEAFLFRRGAAFQAWYEHMPVRRRMIPRGPDVHAYRHLRFGALADLAVLDTRQYRSTQPCGDGFKANCRDADDPARTMLGDTQERWLAEVLRSAQGTWQVLAQQVLFSPLNWRSFSWMRGAEGELHRMDAWDGATAARARVQAMLRDTKARNPVILSGDAHMDLALELKNDWRDAKSPCVGVEFLTTSISSNGDGSPTDRQADAIYADNPHLKFLGTQRGYTRHVVTPQRWQADLRTVERVSTPGAPVATRKSFVVEAGRPGLAEA
jgi:alkaline phosphatase D